MYLIKQNLMTGGKEYKVDDIVHAKDLPKKSVVWLLEQGIIVKITKNYKEALLQKTAKAEEE